MAGATANPVFSKFRRGMLLAGPVLALGLLLFGDLEPGRPEVTRTAAVALLMALWWITGALPLAATALLPLVLFPALAIMSAQDTASEYINDVIFLFLGGFFVALTMQRWDLHRRIALRILLFFGTHPRRLLMGFMAPTFFLSMWISNTATTMMMLPIAASVIAGLEEQQPSPQVRRYGIGLLLGIAFSASIGGTATLIGTPPNISFVRIFAITFPDAPEIPFATWFFFAMPLSLVLLLVLWGLVSLQHCGRGLHLDLASDQLREQYAKLGPPTYEQKVIFVAFVSMAVLWMTRVDIPIGARTIPGWGGLFENPRYLSDGTVAIAIALLLFLLPARSQPGTQLLDWETARGMPWDIILLFGGGFALAKGIATSGLAHWIGAQLQGLDALPPVVLVMLICLSVSFLTELTSNTATTEMLLPVMASLAVSLELHPLLLMIPTTLACSYAFMLPVATPPNAIVFGTRKLHVLDMIRGGVLLNLCAVVLVTFFIFTWGAHVLGIDPAVSPEWAVLPVLPE